MTIRKFFGLISVLTVCMNLGAPLAHAASVIPLQGQLTDQAGAPLNPTSAVSLVFRIYQAPTGGTASWEETQPSVVVIGGRFNVLLGSRTPFDTATLAAFNNTVYLGITVDDGNAGTTDVELRPRQAIVPVIFAENARNADQLDGFDWSSLLINKNTLAPSGDVASPDVIVPGEKVGKVAEAFLADNGSPPGSIIAFAGSAAPVGWLLCDGSTVSAVDYPRLAQAIGSAWGDGDDADPATFRIPDMRGRFLRGIDSGTGRDVDAGARSASAAGGNSGDAVGSVQEDALQGHWHTLHFGPVADWFGSQSRGDWPRDVRDGSDLPNGNNVTPGTPMVRGIISDTVNGAPRISSETRPKNASVNYIIKY